AGVEEIGVFGRGEDMEIASYVGRAVTSELSGNIIDLCPVGALTSKPYAFTARSWELVKTESVDVLDAVGSAIRVDARGDEVMRILPRINEDVNEEWISDKTRFAYDGLRRQRLDRPYVRKSGRLAEVSWDQAFAVIKQRLDGISGGNIAAIAGDLVDCESLFALKGLMASLGSPHMDCRQDGAKLDAACRAGYIFNTTIAGIDEAGACLLIGTNPRWEAPMINARLRRRYLAGNFRVASIGPEVDLTYPVESLGAGPETLAVLAAGKHKFVKELAGADRAMLILGAGAVARADGAAILAAARSIAETTGMIDGDWNGFNLLHSAAGRVGGLDIGFVPGQGGKDTAGILKAAAAGEVKAVYLLGADEIDMGGLGDAFVIYQGHHGDAGAHRADVVLPGAAYSEKTATYVNTEGRAQMGHRAVFPPGDAREDWRIIRALSAALGKTLPFDDAAQLRGQMAGVAPALGRLDEATAADWQPFGTAGAMDPAPFTPAVENFYMTDAISRASVTMAQCTEQLAAMPRPKTGTDD
ncbi:MAG: molybdopterin-dependent oxidoreductase, partial [Alphaproteobacteria bacterium]